MRKFKTMASRRMFSYSSRGPSGEARRTPGQSPLPPVASPNGSGIGLADLPEDIVVLILCHDLELADLVAVSETCRRLYAMSFAELPWIKLWHHLNQRGDLPPPPIAYRRLPDIAAQPFTRRTTLGPDITSSSGSRMRHCSSSSTKTFRSRLQRIYSVERRIRTNEETIRAREVAVLVQDVDSDDWVLMAMTAGGEVVVLWMLSGLLVFDLVHGTSLTVHLDREDSECPENFKFAVTMCEYGGEVGVLVVGALSRSQPLLLISSPARIQESSPIIRSA
ncbi:hypothetical protein DL93DRAFT_1747519 [Clavulina sp. PMI_390]|nr:hypothetical protein DL93DRAFT_1747519 [Clavulina sp. PMI_390]